MAQAMTTEAVSEKTQKTTIDGVQIIVNYANDEDARVSEDEMRAYLKRGYEKYPRGMLETLTLDVEGEDVGIHYGLAR